MISPFFYNDKPLHLDRFPPAQVNRSLQAWDATDEYLINYCADNSLLANTKNILIFNDSFGALTCNLHEYKLFCVSDSYLAQQGCKHNLVMNDIDDVDINYLDSLAPLPDDIDLILYRIPKSKALLSYQLAAIAEKYGSSTTFIAGAKAKEIHTSTLKVFEKYLGETTTSLAVKKSRLVFSKLDNELAPAIDTPAVWPLENTTFSISNYAGVFSRESLDIGARFFIEHLPTIAAQKQVIDLGCGNGVIGLTVLAHQPEANVIFKDESFMAVASAKLNVENNCPQQLMQCRFETDDCLAEEDSSSADIVLCNPPFHQQNATTDHIAWQMFNDAKRVLKKGGELRIIGNRQLGYHIKLKRVFGNCKIIANNKKFVVLSSKKMS